MRDCLRWGRVPRQVVRPRRRCASADLLFWETQTRARCGMERCGPEESVSYGQTVTHSRSQARTGVSAQVNPNGHRTRRAAHVCPCCVTSDGSLPSRSKSVSTPRRLFFFYRVGRVFLRAMNASVSARQNRTRARAPGVAAGTTRFGWPRCRTCECFTAHQVSFNATNSRRCASFKASRLGVLVTGAFCTSQTRARHNIQSPDPLPLSFTAPSTRNGVPRCGICWCWWRTSSRLLTRAGNSMRN
jgi:hypothetical protein